MKTIKLMFTPNHDRYEGVRPINIYLMRVFFLLITINVGSDAWSTIFNFQGEWHTTKAAAVSMWATYSVLLVFGLFNPLRWIPLLVFIIVYKVVWLFMVAYPLWASGQLSGAPAEDMVNSFFLGAILLGLSVPWVYTFKQYIWPFKQRKSS